MEPLEGTMAGKASPKTISTKIERIAELAREIRTEALTSLSHHIDIDWMHEAYRRTRTACVHPEGRREETSADRGANLRG